VSQTEAQKYARELILADLKNSSILLENTLSILMVEEQTKLSCSSFEAYPPSR
jgi:hypothetical protein